MDAASEAAAFWGTAENRAYSVEDRLACALAALDFYGAAYEAAYERAEEEAVTAEPRPNTQEENIAFRKAWDARVDAGRAKVGESVE